jgi:hypothetical protein
MKEKYYRLLLLGVFVAGVALAVIHSVPEILKKIGEAMIIAPVLAVLVDNAAKTKLLREFSLDVSLLVLGRLLPDRLREHLDRYMKMLLVRTRWEITYEIEKWPDQDGFVKLTTISEYDMKNFSERATDYDFRYSVEESQYDKIGGTQITLVRLLPDTFEGEELAKNIKTGNNYKTFTKTMELLPHRGQGKPTYTFRAESVECFRESAFSPFFTFYPVMNAVLRVWYPETIKVSLELTYDDLEIGAKSEPIVQGQRKGTMWTIFGPILPGQGFVVRWDAIAQLPAASGGTTSGVVEPPCQ